MRTLVPPQRLLTCWLLILLLTGSTTLFAQGSAAPYNGIDSFPLNTGDIAFDATLDDPAFTVCNPKVVFQYYNTDSWYKQNKRKIEQYLKRRYRLVKQTDDQTGYLTIRFIINCEGKTGRFRMYELDAHYKPYQFDKDISSQVMKLTKELRDWHPAVYKGKIYDSYQYITFKLKKGAIECVLP